MLEPAEGCRFELASGGTIEVLAAPGHTPGNVVAWNAERGELYTGDTLLPTTIPTPGLHFPTVFRDGFGEGVATAGANAKRWPSLPPFLDSVAALAELPVARILPGHGDAVEDPRALFDRFAEHHARRARRIVAALEAGPATAYEVSRTLFRRLPGQRIGQAMTEVIGHLDVLTDAGRGRIVESAPVRHELTQ